MAETGPKLLALAVWCAANSFMAYRIFKEKTLFHFGKALISYVCLAALFVLSGRVPHSAFSWIAWAMLAALPILSALTFLLYDYFRSTDTYIEEDVFISVFQTYKEEATDFVGHYVPPRSWLAAAGVAAGSFGLLWLGRDALHTVAAPAAYLLAAIFAICLSFRLRRNRLLACYRSAVLNYKKEYERLTGLIDGYRDLPLPDAEKTERGELMVLVIGESSSRDYAGDYCGPVANTPWADRMEKAAGEEFLRFANPYAYSSYTAAVVPTMFKSGNVYTGVNPGAERTLFHVCKAAGVKTAWISNQTVVSAFIGSVVTALAETADYAAFTRKAFTPAKNNNPLDEKAVALFADYLEKLDNAENHFIVIHLYGNHSPYRHQYPPSFPKYRVSDRRTMGKIGDNAVKCLRHDEYLTSLAYTDAMLENIHRLLQAHADRPVGMLYVPDHGEDILHLDYWGHSMRNFTWEKVRIPMHLWVSKPYLERYPEKMRILRDNADRIFTNDLVYDLALDLLNIETPERRPKYSPASAAYSITVENARINHDHMIGDDPDLTVQRNAGKPIVAEMAVVEGAEPVFKAVQAQKMGYRRLAVSAAPGENENGEPDLMLGRSPLDRIGTSMERYLDEVGENLELVWLELVDEDEAVAPAVKAALERLDALFSLRRRCLVQGASRDAMERLAAAGWKTCCAWAPNAHDTQEGQGKGGDVHPVGMVVSPERIDAAGADAKRRDTGLYLADAGDLSDAGLAERLDGWRRERGISLARVRLVSRYDY